MKLTRGGFRGKVSYEVLPDLTNQYRTDRLRALPAGQRTRAAVHSPEVLAERPAMADPWIKMRTNLSRNPKVVHLSVVLGVHVGAVCGACFMLWSIADEHSTDGHLPGYTFEVLDAAIGISGFCKAASVPAVSWTKKTAQGVVLPRFEEHNGDTAKRRAGKAKSEDKNRTKRGQSVDTHVHETSTRARAEQSRAEAAKSREDIAAAASEPNAPELCSLLRAIAHNGVRVFDDAAAAAIAGHTDRMRVEWAVWRMNQKFKHKESVSNPAGYLRNLIENQTPPKSWQAEWRRAQVMKVAEIAAKAGGGE